MNSVAEINRINQRELELGVKGSWHDQYKDSAYVFVGGLSYDLTEGDVITVFSQWGELADINMPRDPETGKPRGFAFLMYVDQRSTVLAVDNMNGAQVVGRTVRVDHCREYRQQGKKNEEGEYVAPEAPTYNALPPEIEPSDSESSAGSADGLDEEDPMAAYLKTQRRLAGAAEGAAGKRKRARSERSDAAAGDEDREARRRRKAERARIREERKRRKEGGGAAGARADRERREGREGSEASAARGDGRDGRDGERRRADGRRDDGRRELDDDRGARHERDERDGRDGRDDRDERDRDGRGSVAGRAGARPRSRSPLRMSADPARMAAMLRDSDARAYVRKKEAMEAEGKRVTIPDWVGEHLAGKERAGAGDGQGGVRRTGDRGESRGRDRSGDGARSGEAGERDGGRAGGLGRGGRAFDERDGRDGRDARDGRDGRDERSGRGWRDERDRR